MKISPACFAAVLFTSSAVARVHAVRGTRAPTNPVLYDCSEFEYTTMCPDFEVTVSCACDGTGDQIISFPPFNLVGDDVRVFGLRAPSCTATANGNSVDSGVFATAFTTEEPEEGVFVITIRGRGVFFAAFPGDIVSGGIPQGPSLFSVNGQFTLTFDLATFTTEFSNVRGKVTDVCAQLA